MKLSTRGRYGLRAMFDLAMNESQGPIPLNEIADRQNISESYLEQLFAILRREGLVNSVRGAHGGYLLGASLMRSYRTDTQNQRAILHRLIVLEMKCSRLHGCDACVTRIIWEKIRDSINQVIDSITLEDMVNQQRLINSKRVRIHLRTIGLYDAIIKSDDIFKG